MICIAQEGTKPRPTRLIFAEKAGARRVVLLDTVQGRTWEMLSAQAGISGRWQPFTGDQKQALALLAKTTEARAFDDVLFRDQEHCPAGAPSGGQFTGPNASNCGDGGTAEDGKASGGLPATAEHGALAVDLGPRDRGLFEGSHPAWPYRIADVASLIPPGASGTLYRDKWGGLGLKMAGGGIAQSVRFFSTSGIENHILEVDPSQRGKGIATELLAREVALTDRLGGGLNHISLQAMRDDRVGQEATGYKVWPRLGFQLDFEVGKDFSNTHDEKEFLRRMDAAGLGDAHSVLDLMQSAKGRAFWDQHGLADRRMFFDTRKGSRSRAILDAALHKRRKAR